MGGSGGQTWQGDEVVMGRISDHGVWGGGGRKGEGGQLSNNPFGNGIARTERRGILRTLG